MKPGAEVSSEKREAPEGAQRRRVRLFVALHLGAVGLIYAVALFLGGGFAGPNWPPAASTLALASVQPPANPAPRGEAVPQPVAHPLPAAVQPAWTQRAELPPPWEAR